MSAAQRRRQDWWLDEDDQVTQAVPVRAIRGAAPARAARSAGSPVALQAVATDLPRPSRSARAGAAEARGRGLPLPALPSLPNLSKLLTTGLVIGALALLLYLGITSLLTWTRLKLDDLHYGRPRTSQIDAWVGHGEGVGTPTHLVAMNLNRRVTIVEFPGGDVTKPQVIVGPYLFGRAEDLTVVKLRVEDANDDAKPDLIVQVKDERLVYINENGGFRPITAEELAQLRAKEGGR